MTPWTVARQAPLSMGYSRQEYWSGLPCPPPEDLPNPWIEPGVSCSSCTAGRFFTTEPPGKPPTVLTFLFLPFYTSSICLNSIHYPKLTLRNGSKTSNLHLSMSVHGSVHLLPEVYLIKPFTKVFFVKET